MNYKKFASPEFKDAEKAVEKTLADKGAKVMQEVESLLKDGE